MALTDLLKGAGRVVQAAALGLAMYGCGGAETSADKYAARCEQLCTRVWKDCSGLPGANYNFGQSYNSCINGCPNFLEGINDSPYSEEMNAAIDCIIDTENCQFLETDYCEMDEGDLFTTYVPDKEWTE